VASTTEAPARTECAFELRKSKRQSFEKLELNCLSPEVLNRAADLAMEYINKQQQEVDARIASTQGEDRVSRRNGYQQAAV
jgi:hypothetical protein